MDRINFKIVFLGKSRLLMKMTTRGELDDPCKQVPNFQKTNLINSGSCLSASHSHAILKRKSLTTSSWIYSWSKDYTFKSN